MPELMTTREVADYLRIKERKVYDLLRDGRIPSTRVTGKWLFPRHLIDLWLAQRTDLSGVVGGALEAPPPVVAGSHDPLLDWALRDAGADLASMCRGSFDGLERFAKGDVLIAGLHIPGGPETASGHDGGDARGGNVESVKAACTGLGVVLVRWAERSQGLVVAPGNPLGLGSVADLARTGARVMERPPEAGSHGLLKVLLAKEGLDLDMLTSAGTAASNETDLGLAIKEERADAGLAIAAVAEQYGLGFVPLVTEAFDLLIRRRDYFEAPFQKLLAFAARPAFAERAAALGGYDVSGVGRIVYNAP